MKQIIGNIDAVIQEKTITRNKIGESVEAWTTKETLKGYLDYQSGEAQTQVVNAKVEQSTHIFICDYQPLAYEEEQIRMLINNKPYEVMLIDDPQFRHYHLEIYLKYVGA